MCNSWQVNYDHLTPYDPPFYDGKERVMALREALDIDYDQIFTEEELEDMLRENEEAREV